MKSAYLKPAVAKATNKKQRNEQVTQNERGRRDKD